MLVFKHQLGVVVLALLAGNFTSARASGPDPSEVYVQSIAYGGTGCPQGSVGSSLASDRQSFTLIYDQFVASAGPGIPKKEAHKNCELNINVRVPNGWRFTIVSIDYRGYVQLDEGMTATQQATFYFDGQEESTSTARFEGPISRDYLVRDTVGLETVVWSPCGEVATINLLQKLRINSRNNQDAQGQITTDSTDGKVMQVYGVVWEQC